MELRSVGAPAEFAFPPADHLALGASLGLLDFDAGAPPVMGGAHTAVSACMHMPPCRPITWHWGLLQALST